MQSEATNSLKCTTFGNGLKLPIQKSRSERSIEFNKKISSYLS